MIESLRTIDPPLESLGLSALIDVVTYSPELRSSYSKDGMEEVEVEMVILVPSERAALIELTSFKV